MGGGRKDRSYQKIVGPPGLRGHGLFRGVDGHADPPGRSQAARFLGAQTGGGQLNPDGIDRQRHVETVVHEEPVDEGGADGARECEMLAAGECVAAGMRGDRGGGGEAPGPVGEIGEVGDPFVGNRVQPREPGLARRAHTMRWPARTPRPRIQSSAPMRGLPAGWTSAIESAPEPVATTSSLPARSTSPGAPWPAAGAAPKSFTSRPSRVVQAPGFGSRAWTTRRREDASRSHAMWPVSRVSLGAYVARS